jgi:very-short-patch-repair endonuclease
MKPFMRMPHERLRSNAKLWELVRRQHGVITRTQLLAGGLSADAIQRRIAAGRLHPLWRGVYAVGRPEVDRYGRWMAATLSCGSHALLSHSAAAALWEMLDWDGSLDVVLPPSSIRRRSGVRVHRRSGLGIEHRRVVLGIPVADPVSTIVDLAEGRSVATVERAVREADRLDLVDPEALRSALDEMPRRPGIARLRTLLDAETFAHTDSGLERRFLRLVREAGLPEPETQVWLNGFRVDFYWRDLGLVVETDGLKYHRTPTQQKKDRLRDQAHTAAGLTVLRFADTQLRHEAARTVSTLRAVMTRLQPGAR